MTIGALRLKIRTFERGTIPSQSLGAAPVDAVVGERRPVDPEFDDDGRLYVFRFPVRRPEPVAIDRDRIFEYARRRRPTVGGRPIRLLPDTEVRRFVRDLKNSADFYTGVRELQTHADVETVSAVRERNLIRLRR